MVHQCWELDGSVHLRLCDCWLVVGAVWGIWVGLEEASLRPKSLQDPGNQDCQVDSLFEFPCA